MSASSDPEQRPAPEGETASAAAPARTDRPDLRLAVTPERAPEAPPTAVPKPAEKRPGPPVPGRRFPGRGKPGRKVPAGFDPQVGQAIAKANRRKRSFLLGSFALICLLPTLVVGLYMAFFASEQFASRASFAIRGNESVSSSDLVGMVLGGSNSAVNAPDSYIVEEFIHSRSMVDRLDANIGLRERYDTPAADWWARFAADEPVESFVGYWALMTDVAFDSFTGIISVEVKAFTAEDAKVIAAGVVAESERLVNALSERARLDSVAFAQREVQFAEERLREARLSLASFRDRESTMDPASTAEANEKLIAELNGDLARAQAELSQAEAAMGPDAPTVRFHKARIEALLAQIAERKKLVAMSGDGIEAGGLSGQMSAFEALSTEVGFAEKAYLSSLASLEQARLEAKQKQRYLATFLEPSDPTIAEYPQRMLDTLLVFLAALLAWGISMLLFAAVRDHVA